LYRSGFTSDALQDIKGLPKNVRNALKREFLKKIHIDPIGCSEPLTGRLEGFRSFHHGDYRVVYQVFAKLGAVSVVGVGKKDEDHQAEIYRRLEALANKGKLAEAVLRSLGRP
jgi:mRNA-degrading endonuclease RelE of RelBE toxin-antitoxin system